MKRRIIVLIFLIVFYSSPLLAQQIFLENEEPEPNQPIISQIETSPGPISIQAPKASSETASEEISKKKAKTQSTETLAPNETPAETQNPSQETPQAASNEDKSDGQKNEASANAVNETNDENLKSPSETEQKIPVETAKTTPPPLPPPPSQPLNPVQLTLKWYDMAQKVRFLETELMSSREQIQTLETQIKAKEETHVETGHIDIIGSYQGLGGAASKVYFNPDRLSIGMSAELLTFTDDRSEENNIVTTLKVSPILGYRIKPDIIFNSQFNFENTGSESHSAGSNQNGQAIVEFAYVDYLHKDDLNFRVGLQRLPVGLLNMLNEPIYYFGVSLPEVESELIPSTWRESGILVYGQYMPNLYYSVGAFNSLDANGFEETNFIKTGRQNGQLAKAENFAAVARSDYIDETTIVGLSLFGGQTAQDLDSVENAYVILWDIHFKWSWEELLYIQGVHTQANVSDSESLSLVLPKAGGGTHVIGSKAMGTYFTVALDILKWMHPNQEAMLPIFVRYTDYDLHAEVPTGFTRNLENSRKRITLGVNYLPRPNWVFKLNYQFRENKQEDEDDLFQFGMGLVF